MEILSIVIIAGLIVLSILTLQIIKALGESAKANLALVNSLTDISNLLGTELLKQEQITISLGTKDWPKP